MGIRVDFYVGRGSIQDLAKEQGIEPLEDVRGLEGWFPDDENIDQFLDDIYTARKERISGRLSGRNNFVEKD